MADEAHIPNARDTVVGVSGRNGHGWFRTYCGACDAAEPLTGQRDPIWGGKPGTGEVEGACDCCRVSFDDLSARQQQEHDDQQAKWSRESRVEYVIEMGCVSAIRCRVY